MSPAYLPEKVIEAVPNEALHPTRNWLALVSGG